MRGRLRRELVRYAQDDGEVNETNRGKSVLLRRAGLCHYVLAVAGAPSDVVFFAS